MFLKRIEFLGFKSFATKTTMELIPGVTVVVGPNGCGKSNILDAIKWVLGTQSARSLRGGKMSDVIFGGSSSFKPLGMAQVTLTLDNSRRTLDIDYDEVQVARRLYRTGESEYLLNKVPCRLRDIHDLFLGTGIGTSSYSILEQGKVDQIINAKPIERRFIIEEAAGISKYKIRRAEAMRKLERTQTDLSRLNDLVDEIGRQVNSLKRQASKAERYREHKGQLRNLEMELLVLRSASLRKQIAEREKQLAELSDQNEVLSVKHARGATEQETLREKAEVVAEKLSKENDELLGIKNRITNLEHQIERHRDRIGADGRRLAQIEEESSALNERDRELRGRIDDHDGRLEKAREEDQSAQARFEAHQREYKKLEEAVGERGLQLEATRSDMIRRRENLSRRDNEIRIAEALILRQEETRKEAAEEMERLGASAEANRQRRNELDEQIDALGTRVAEKEKELSSLQLRHAETHGRIAELGETLEQARRDLHQHEARLSTLSELKANHEGFYQGVREVMTAAEQGKLKGVVGPVAGLIKSEQRYELALESALGGRLQDIVVADGDAACAAMDFLSAADGGRATFWPLKGRRKTSRPEQLEAVLAEKDVLGCGAQLVKCETRFAPIVEALLSRAILVTDLEAARGLAGRYESFTFVSLDGRMIDSAGAYTGGAAKVGGLLGREREIGELTEALTSLKDREKELRDQIEEERSAVGGLDERIKAAGAGRHELDVEKANLDKDCEAVARSLEESDEHRRRREAQLTQAQNEINAHKALIDKNSVAKIEHERRIGELEAQLADQRDQARAQTEEYQMQGAQLAETRAEIGKVHERLRHLEDQRTALDRERAALTSDRKAREAEGEELRAECSQCETEIEQTREELQSLFDAREGLQRELSVDQNEREQLTLRLRELEHAIGQLARDQRVVENDLHEKQLDYRELQTKLSGLNEQANEKFDRDLFDIAEQLGHIEKDQTALGAEVAQLREKIERMGQVNLAALEEYEQQKERLEFLTGQRDDLVESKAKIESSIATIDETTKKLFHETFEIVRGHFIEMFRRLFNGGKADLIIEQDTEDPLLDGGIEIYAQPPGKKLQTLSLMSGGEKAMTAISLLFALFLHKPAPFAILDEIDAPLDDANVERFKAVVTEFGLNTQFIIISHNKQTMELADVIYGVTMEESGVSKLVSVRFEHAEQYLEPAVS